MNFMEQASYTKSDFNIIINSYIKEEILQNPTFAIDHIRRAFVDMKIMIKNPNNDVYTFVKDYTTLLKKHQEIIVELNQQIDNNPDKMLQCDYCDKTVKPAAMLNHYYKKHSLEDYYNSCVEKYCKLNLNCKQGTSPDKPEI